MKADIVGLDGSKLKSINLPKQFDEEPRLDLIKRAILTIWSQLRQPYGSDPRAGKKHSVYISKRRHAFRCCYGHGISRANRKVMWRRGTQFGWVGAFSPGTVGGRKAHPPKAEKVWKQKINDKERRKAIRCALSWIANSNNLTVVDSKFEGMNKTKEVISVLKKMNFSNELERLQVKKIRAGRGKTRGRKYKKKLGPIIVVSKDCKLKKSADNLQGFDIVEVNRINTKLLVSGIDKPRKAIFTEDSINRLEKEGLFLK